MATGDLIAAAEAADLLGVDRSTIVRWAQGGKLSPAMQLPGRTGSYLFLRSDVERLRKERVT